MDSGLPLPPKYVKLNDDKYPNIKAPPGHRRNVPRYHYHRHQLHSKGSSRRCCKCMCCFYSCLTIIVLVFFLLALAVYAFYKPKLPSYKVDSFNVKAFDVKPDSSFYTEFAITIKAKNPNKHISIKYEKDNSVIASYRGKTICSGKLPAFRQPVNDLSNLKVVMKGKSDKKSGLGLQEALLKNQKSGKIPLDVRVKAPVTIVLGDLGLKSISVSITCSLLVDKLSKKSKTKILSNDCRYKIKT